MAGFGGSTGVSKEYVDRAIAQSTAVADGSSSFTPGSGITPYYVYLKRTGNVCVLRGRLSIDSSIAGINATVGTLPDGYRPAEIVRAYMYSTYANTNGYFQFRINPSGEMLTEIGSSTLTGNIYLDLVFMTA